MLKRSFSIFCTFLFAQAIPSSTSLYAQPQQRLLNIDFVDSASQQPVAARMEFLNSKKNTMKPKNGLVVEKQVLVEGATTWNPALGNHEFWIRRGIEFTDIRGNLIVEEDAKDAKTILIERKTDMHAEGWYSGDLLSTLEPKQLQRWQAADELDVCVTVYESTKGSDAKTLEKKPSDRNRTKSEKETLEKPEESVTYDARSLKSIRTGSYWDDRKNSGLVIHGWRPEKDPDKNEPSGQLIVAAKKNNKDALVEIQSLVARDVPIWLASQRIDLVQVLSTHLRINEEEPLSDGIRNPEPIRFTGSIARGKLTEYVYWQMLEAGLRIPPSAGTGFGKKGLDTHLGYNRVYASLPKDPNARSEEAWWKSLLDGHTFLTNGPLLRASVNGIEPGETFQGSNSQKIELGFDIQLTVRDPVDYLDVVFNGQKLYEARLEEHAARGRFPPLSVSESGWLLVRVVTGKESTYRLATTAPYYFEFDGQRRISRKAVQFFQEWLEDSAKRISKEPNAQAHLPYIESARKFWNHQLEKANAD